MNILHLQLSGNPGGIVSLCRDIANNSKNKHFMFFIFSGGIITEKMKSEGIDVIVSGAHQYFWKESIELLIDYCMKNKIDMIVNHSNSPVAITHSIVAKKRIKNLKLMMYLHSASEDSLGCGKSYYLHLLFSNWMRIESDAIVAISEFVKNSYLKVWKNKSFDKIHVIYNGVDNDKFKPNEMSNSRQKNRFIYVGRLFDKKGINELLEAFSMLPKEDRYTLTIVGDGEMKTNYENKARMLGIANNVTFLGARTDVPQILMNADYFVHPAIWDEGFGISIVEAMSAGVPCIAFNKGAIPEIITDDENGFLIDEVSARNLSKRIHEDIFEISLEKYACMREKAIARASFFSINSMIVSLEGLIYEICSK